MNTAAVRTGLLFVAGAVLLVAGFFRFQDDLGAWRLDEVDSLLGQQTTRGLSESFSLLVGRMELLRSRAQQPAESAATDLLEIRLQKLASAPLDTSPVASGPPSWERSLVLGLVEALRLMEGKAGPVNNGPDPALAADLQKAYLWERGRRYEGAIPLYENLLSSKEARGLVRAALLLHLGFCQALTGDRPGARTRFRQVEAEFPGTEAATTAQRLASFLDYVDTRLASPPATKDPVVLGEWALSLTDYAAARTYLDQAASSGEPAPPRLTFARARLAEETGRAPEAEILYRKNLDSLAASPGATGDPAPALRRLYVLGSAYEGQPVLAATARRALEVQGAAGWLAPLPADPATPGLPVDQNEGAVPIRFLEHPITESLPQVPAPFIPAAVGVRSLGSPVAILAKEGPMTIGWDAPQAALARYVFPGPWPGPSGGETPLLPTWPPPPQPGGGNPWAVGLLSAGGSGLAVLAGSLVTGALTYPSYQKATDSAEAARLHDQLLLLQGVNLGAATVAAVGLAVGGIWLWLDPGTTAP